MNRIPAPPVPKEVFHDFFGNDRQRESGGLIGAGFAAVVCAQGRQPEEKDLTAKKGNAK
jgi:hypothetical protein